MEGNNVLNINILDKRNVLFNTKKGMSALAWFRIVLKVILLIVYIIGIAVAHYTCNEY